MSRKSTTLLVANPTARTGRAERAIRHAMEVLSARGLSPEFLATEPLGKTVTKLAARIEADDVTRVVYLGGDGTFAEAAKGIILARERSGIDVPLGMLPMGTANDQGRSFGIHAGERALEHNVRIIEAGLEQWLDAGSIEALSGTGDVIARDLFFDSAGFGLSAQILARRNRDKATVGRIPVLRTLYRDKVVYTFAAIRSLADTIFGRRHFSVEIVVDDTRYEHAKVTDLLVMGTILYAGDWIFDPDARSDDGKFEVVVVRGPGDWAAGTLSRHKRNPVTRDDLEVLGLPHREVKSGRDLEIRIFRPRHVDSLYAQIDGEEFTSADHYRITNLHHHLRIIVPEDAHWV